MAWALVGEDNWGVTARMTVDFRKPVAVGMPIRAEGWITRARRRIVETEGHIVDADDRDRAGDGDRHVRRGRRRPASKTSANAMRIVRPGRPETPPTDPPRPVDVAR